MRILHLINSSDIRRGGAQKILEQIVSADSESQYVFGAHNDLGIFKFLWPLKLIVKLLILRPNIVVGHSRFFLPLIYLIEKSTSVKTVFVCHNIFLSKNWIFKYFPVGSYIAISKSVKSSLSFFVPPERINLILNGTDCVPPSECFIPTKSIEIAFIGSLTKVKGVGLAIDALNSFTELTGEQVKFHVVGDGQEVEGLKAKKTNEGLTVKFHGYSNNPFSVIKNVELVLIPSYHEGFCLVLVESIINKKLVFASNLPVLKEVADGVGTVKFFPAGDAQSLQELVARYASGSIPNNELDSSAEHALKLYSLKNMQENYLSYYASL